MPDPKGAHAAAVFVAGPAHSTNAAPSWMRMNQFGSLPMRAFCDLFGIDYVLDPEMGQRPEHWKTIPTKGMGPYQVVPCPNCRQPVQVDSAHFDGVRYLCCSGCIYCDPERRRRLPT